MRILFVSLLEAHWGGSEALWSQTAHVLLGQGHPVAAFFAYYKNVKPIVALRAAGCETAYGTPPPTRWWKRIWRPPATPLERFAAFLKSWRPDLVVFCQGGLLEGLEPMAFCARCRQPYVIINQLVAPWHDAKRWTAAREAFCAARRIWFVSAENLEAATAWLAGPLLHADVTPNTSSCASDTPPSWPDTAEGLRLACVGRLDPRQKGQDLLIDALTANNALWRDRGLRVTFFGRGEDEPLLRERCRWRGCDRVDFGGFVESPSEIWRTHHALVLPSRYEGQSVAMLEAMLWQRPVLVTPVGGTKGLIRPHRNGFLARSIDTDGIAALLEEAWHSRAAWLEIGRNAASDAQAWIGRNPAEDMAQSLLRVLSAHAH